MNQKTGEEQTIGGHTLDQLFFVAFSQVDCPYLCMSGSGLAGLFY